MNMSDAKDVQKRSLQPAAIGICAVGSLLTGLVTIAGPFLRRYSGAPYVASAPVARAAIRSWLATFRQSYNGAAEPRMTDLGAGSGELVLDAAKAGFQARGVELNPWLVLRAFFRVYGLPPEVRKRVTFKKQDLWKSQLEEEDVIVVFGVPDMMRRVGELVERQCKDSCVVCCNTFPIPGWIAMKKNGNVYFYTVGEQRRQQSSVRNTRVGITEAVDNSS